MAKTGGHAWGSCQNPIARGSNRREGKPASAYLQEDTREGLWETRSTTGAEGQKDSTAGHKEGSRAFCGRVCRREGSMKSNTSRVSSGPPFYDASVSPQGSGHTISLSTACSEEHGWRRQHKRRLLFDHQHRTRGMAYDALGHAAHQQPLEPGSAVAPHDDQVRLLLYGNVYDPLVYRPFRRR